MNTKENINEQASTTITNKISLLANLFLIEKNFTNTK
jgi:hypothetical protein